MYLNNSELIPARNKDIIHSYFNEKTVGAELPKTLIFSVGLIFLWLWIIQ